MSSKIAVYPGSFDPIHKGHIAILVKALKLFDLIYLVVTFNPDKESQTPLLTRFNDATEKLKNFENVKVIMNENDFTANVAKTLGAKFVIRSARNNKEFNYEMELAAGNNHLNKDLETILIIPDYKFIDYSSTLLRHQKRLKKDV